MIVMMIAITPSLKASNGPVPIFSSSLRGWLRVARRSFASNKLT
jgi:hypothetical protein